MKEKIVEEMTFKQRKSEESSIGNEKEKESNSAAVKYHEFKLLKNKSIT